RFIVFYHMSRQKPHATLFAYTTLFRSGPAQRRLPDRLPSMVGECSRCSGSRRLERRTGRILLEQQVQRLQDLHLRLEHDENAAAVIGEVDIRLTALAEQPLRADDRLHDD